MCIAKIHFNHGKYQKRDRQWIKKKKKSKGVLFSFQRVSAKCYTETMPFVLDKAWVGLEHARWRKRISEKEEKESSRNNGMDIKKTLDQTRKGEGGLFCSVSEE